MFSFGQFSQFLPFFILAITTLASFTTVTYSRHAMKAENEACQQKEIRLKEIPSNHTEKVASIFHLNNQSFFTTNTTSPVIPFVYRSLISLSPPGKGDFLVLLHSSALPFLRPPPIFS